MQALFERNQGLANHNVDAILQSQKQRRQHGTKQRVASHVTTSSARSEQSRADQADLPERVVVILILIVKSAFFVIVIA